MTQEHAEYIIENILEKKYNTFSFAKKLIKNTGSRTLNNQITEYLVSQGCNKSKESNYLSKNYNER